MAQEIKNTFLKSKMNKDLDDRLLPNGEYKDARNISVGRSEDSDVGALENVVGNNLVAGTDIGNNLTIIGIESSNSTDELFVFLTDYTDPSPTSPTNAPPSSKHYIYVYNSSTKNYTLLVQGEFLNFSTTNRIIGINLIESLLFWTDNRNQPRKINISLARAFLSGGLNTSEGDYYTEEHQISVAKYNPYQAIQLYNRVDLQARLGATTTTFTIEGHRRNELIEYLGATVVCSETTPSTSGNDYVKVVSIFDSFTSPNITTITVSPGMQAAPGPNDFISLIISTMSNKNDDATWPGDPDYLEDKFVRFSYRFKFDDNEYSLMAPFTQIAYIPKQNGFFVNGDENSAYQSTIVDFMENLVQNVGLVIPLPTSANKLAAKYKISDIEILFRESNAIAVKVLTSISEGNISAASGQDNYYTYDYQSKKPYRTLPEAQTVRVYDKVPVRAFSQESSGNRIIYGNFKDQHTPPTSINYNCRIEPKSSTGAFNNWIEYPNNSVKRNRNYQIGFVLADKFGRQSPVILSSNDDGTTEDNTFYAGSTIYAPYDLLGTDTNTATWAGDAIQVLVNQPIESEIDLATGTPGLYAIKQQNNSTGEGFAIAASLLAAGSSTITDSTFTFRLDNDPTTGFPDNTNIPQVGDSMRGAYDDFVKVTNTTGPNAANQYVVTTDSRVSSVYLRNVNLPSDAPDLKFAYTINDLGWYSYKIVVKQTEQDYYNVYLPGILNGYPGQDATGAENGPFPLNELNLTAHTVLFNDNINKIPRDLREVGDQDLQYRSSTPLYGIVTNTMTSATEAYNTQYYPRLDYTGKTAVTHTATTIATAKDLDMAYAELSSNPLSGGGTGGVDGKKVFYQIDTNPLIARLSTTEKPIGQQNTENNNVEPYNMLPYLAIYETAPVESLLNIYWETTSEGLIVDLNQDIASTNAGVASFQNLVWEFKEDIAQGTAVTTDWFSPVNNQGVPLAVPLQSAAIISAIDEDGNSATNIFSLQAGTFAGGNEGEFKIIFTGEGKVFEQASATRDVYSFQIECVTADDVTSVVLLPGVVGGFGAFENMQPDIDAFPNIEKLPTDEVIISESDISGKNPTNGTILNGATLSQVKYSFRELATSSPIPVDSNGDLLWVMNEVTGKLTQSSNPELYTPPGIYRIAVRVTDANAFGSPTSAASGFGSLYVEENVYIEIKAVPVNQGAKSVACVINPEIIPENGYSEADNNDLVVNPNGTTGVFGGWQGNQPASCIYYITEEDIAIGWPSSANQAIDEAFYDRGITPIGTFPFNLSYGSSTFPAENIRNNTGVFRIGTESHKAGEISFCVNSYAPRNKFVYPNQSNLFRAPVADFYYRRVGDTDWVKLPRINSNIKELNTVGFNFDIQAGFNFDLPKMESNYRLDNSTYYNQQNVVVDEGDEVWIQTVRAFDFTDFPIPPPSSGVPSPLGIEYCIVVQGQVTTPNQNVDLNVGMIRSWITVDDLNFPSCVPWQGINAVVANGAGNLFKYFRSAESSSSVEFKDANTLEVWARSPYADYVERLYTNANGTALYEPPSAFVPYINLRLNTGEIGVTEWTTFTTSPDPPIQPIPDAEALPLQFSIKIGPGGSKAFSTNSVQGVSAIRVFSDQTYYTKGALRISKKT